MDSLDNFHCLSYDPSTPSLYGINGWVKETISAIGNLSERDYNVEDVVEQLKKLSIVAPSLNLVVHCGGEYESKECVATVILSNGNVETKEPQIDRLMEVSDSQMMGNLFKNLCKGRA